jgi:hypothetical protein
MPMSVKFEHQAIKLLEQMIDEQGETNRHLSEIIERLHNLENGLGVSNQELKNLTLTAQDILAILQQPAGAPISDFFLYQLIKGDFEMISGTVVGTTSTFKISFVPVKDFIPLTSGPIVSVDDPMVTLSAVDASNNFTASVAAGDTGASYNITVTGVNNLGATIAHVFNIPILPTPPPAPTPVTDFGLDQTS